MECNNIFFPSIFEESFCNLITLLEESLTKQNIRILGFVWMEKFVLLSYVFFNWSQYLKITSHLVLVVGAR